MREIINMKRRQEEVLIQMAFGDMPESQVGCPEAQAKLRSYCELRQGLQSLKDIPEMQMSTERLRDAILNGGLKPTPVPKLSLSWIAASVAVCAVGFMAVSRMGSSGASGPVVLNEAPTTVSTPIVLDWQPTSPKIDPENWLGFDDSIQIQQAVVTTPRKSNPVRLARKTVDESKTVAAAPVVAETSKGANLEPDLALRPGVADSNLTAGITTETNDIVVIDAQAQNDEGISRAKEVKPTTNVVIGG